MIRRLLPVVLVLTACGTAPARIPAQSTAEVTDPVALLETWKEVMTRQESVRFEVETRAEGPHARWTRWSGSLHLATTGFVGSTLRSETTMRHESRSGPRGYHAIELSEDRETYLEHHRLVLPGGKRYLRLDFATGAAWVWELDREISMDHDEFHPSGLFVDLDRDTLRLVEASGNRYRLAAGRAVESNPATSDDSEVTLTVWVDDQDRVTRAEQASRGDDGHPHRKTTTLSDWGAAPEVERPAPETVASPAEADLSPR